MGCGRAGTQAPVRVAPELGAVDSGRGEGIVFMSALRVLFMPFIRLAKDPHKHRYDFCRMHETEGLVPLVPLGFPRHT